MMFTIGQRVEIPAHTDSWMAGARFGEVVKVTPTRIHVRLDRTIRGNGGYTLPISRESMNNYGRVV